VISNIASGASCHFLPRVCAKWDFRCWRKWA